MNPKGVSPLLILVATVYQRLAHILSLDMVARPNLLAYKKESR